MAADAPVATYKFTGEFGRFVAASARQALEQGAFLRNVTLDVREHKSLLRVVFTVTASGKPSDIDEFGAWLRAWETAMAKEREERRGD